jgi:hypothetical protein
MVTSFQKLFLLEFGFRMVRQLSIERLSFAMVIMCIAMVSWRTDSVALIPCDGD